ncbi:MAG: nitroreductase [Micromonosporaceae bacterium]|nr:nitroreductase [Micromonosporaceae bacterium]
MAPSIHNTQPWHWRIHGAEADLHLDPSRLLDVTDPDHRLAILSCGTALHHVRLALAAEGWRSEISRLPDPSQPGHLARVRLTDRADPSPDAMQLVQAARVRHTDRRPVTATPIDERTMGAVLAAVEAETAHLHLLKRDQVLTLAAAAASAQEAEKEDTSWVSELAYWTGGEQRPAGAGIPDTAIPERPTETTVPSRDFGHHGTQPVSAEHDRAAVFGVLYGDGDDPEDWLRAGEALSAAWLLAEQQGVSVVPISAPVEVTTTRETIRQLLAGLGLPYLVIRFGVPDPGLPGPEYTPRLQTSQTVEIVEA